MFVQPESFSNTLLTWICVEATEDSQPNVSLKCTSDERASNNCDGDDDVRNDAKKDGCTKNSSSSRIKSYIGRTRNLNSTINIATPSDVSNDISDIHIPIGSHIVSLHYQSDAWIALRSLKVSNIYTRILRWLNLLF